MKISTFKLPLLLMGFGANMLFLQAQITFTNANSSLHSDAGVLGSNANNRSGNAVCIVDVNGDGLDDIAKLDNNQFLRIEYQQSGGTFNYVYVGDCGHTSLWGLSMADVDHNGYKDLLYGSGSQAYLYKLNATGTGFLGAAVSLPNGAVFCQNMNFMDVNNDGWEDIFSTNDVDECRLWVNDGTGNFPAEQANSIINFNLTPGTGPGPALSGPAPNDQYDESGNYSSIWTDFDNDGDVDFYVAHCRQGSSTGDVRRLDRLWVNNGNGTYTEAGATYNLNSGEEDWTSSFGDFDNDGDFDQFLTRVNVSSQLFTNNGSGTMTALSTLAPGFNQPYQSIFVDFDNDTYVDILMCGVSAQQLYRNNGNNTFSLVSNATLGFGSNIMLSFATGDLNHDGKIDIYASYGTGYNTPSGSKDDVYWRNTTANSNHFIGFNLTGTVSTAGALGARVFIYGPWGVQTREVRASEAYGTENTLALHFGLGSATSVDSVRINWPSGNTQVLLNQTADQYVSITEQNCTLSGISVSYSGATTFCSGDSLQLTAPASAGYTYLWSNGATTQSIYAHSTAAYSVTVSTSPTCSATSPAVNVVVNPTESVTITAGGPTTFCPGGSVTLTSSSATANTWSNSATTQSIVVNTAGTYSVNYQGLCQTWPSNTITVTLLNNSAPATTNDYIPAPGTGTLTATGVGTDINWYSNAVGGTSLYNGTTFITPSVSVNTTYYAEEVHSYGGGTGTVGSTNIAAATYSGNTTNGFLKFDVLANCTLTSVDVSTDAAGIRIIELRDNLGAVISSYSANLAVGTTTVPVNFALTPGTNYQLGTNTAQNNTTLGFNSPRLVRETVTPVYPYTLASAVSITTGNNGTTDNTSYYYFFNWQINIAPTDVCTSARTPATVYITAGVEPNSSFNFMVYPNPTTDYANIQFTTPESGEAMLSVFDMLGKKVYDLNLGSVNGNVIRTISTATYAKGVYNVKLTINGKDYNTRLIVK